MSVAEMDFFDLKACRLEERQKNSNQMCIGSEKGSK